MKQRRITPILIFFASVCLLCLVTGATAAPLISKYGFAPLFSIVKVKVPVFREFQAFGPFVFHESFGGRDIWGIRPLFSRLEEKKAGNSQWEVLYPLGRFQSGGKSHRYFSPLYRSDSYKENGEERFAFFPFFWGKTPEGKTYGGVFPFYGHLVNRFGKKDIRFFLWPLYARSEKDGMVKTNYLWPFFASYSGAKGEGSRFWPFWGHQVKKGVYQKDFFLFPFFVHTRKNLDTENPEETRFFFPFYGRRERQPYLHETHVLWPIFRDMRNNRYHYHRWDMWPVFTRAKGDTIDWLRLFPFYEYRIRNKDEKGRPDEKRIWFWPVFKEKHYWAGETEIQDTHFLVLSRVLKERNAGESWRIKEQNLWPLFHDVQRRHERSWAFPDPFPFTFEGYIRNLRPLWTLADGRIQGGMHRTRFLWGLYDHIDVKKAALTDIAGLIQWEHEGKDIHRFSLLQGILKYENISGHASLRFFFIPWRLNWQSEGQVVVFEREEWGPR